jgi:predicted ribosome quality control (RQC) complex YloA/Tae2 family protein
VGELVSELAPLFERGRLVDIVGLPPADLVLVFECDAAPSEATAPRSTTRKLGLRISACADAPRLHLEHARTRAHSGPLGPFFRTLEAALLADKDKAGAPELVRLSQVRGDRIVALELRSGPLEQTHTLLAELTGRHANLFWLGPGDVILAALDASSPRAVSGRSWTPPPGAAPVREQPALGLSFAEPAETPPRHAGLAPLSWRIEHALGGQAHAAELERDRKSLLERLARREERARGLVRGLEERLRASERAGDVMREGELLKANLARVQRGMSTLVVEDFFDEALPARTLKLDPRLGPRENLERIFERAKKLERAHALVQQELLAAREKQAGCAARLEEARRTPDPQAFEAELIAAGWLEPRQQVDERGRNAPAPRLPYREFKGLHGGAIRVGRSAKDNDQLSLKLSRGNDVWLHTADTPGSHVVLVLAGRSEPDSEDLLDAGHLAVHFSPLRGARKARLHLARCKEVHKPRGAKPGLVHLSGGKTWELVLQPARLERLLGGPRGPHPDQA